MSKAKKVAAPVVATGFAAQVMSAAASISAELPTRHYYGANVKAVLPKDWTARAGQVLAVTNPDGLARAIVRYETNGHLHGKAYYEAMVFGGTVQEWADRVAKAGYWEAAKQLTRDGGQHPTKFLDAAKRNGWITLA